MGTGDCMTFVQEGVKILYEKYECVNLNAQVTANLNAAEKLCAERISQGKTPMPPDACSSSCAQPSESEMELIRGKLCTWVDCLNKTAACAPMLTSMASQMSELDCVCQNPAVERMMQGMEGKGDCSGAKKDGDSVSFCHVTGDCMTFVQEGVKILYEKYECVNLNAQVTANLNAEEKLCAERISQGKTPTPQATSGTVSLTSRLMVFIACGTAILSW